MSTSPQADPTRFSGQSDRSLGLDCLSEPDCQHAESSEAAGSGCFLLPPRYVDLGNLGKGGMGEVRWVLDRVLNRRMALKAIRCEFMSNPAEIARFIEEAQATSQLQHPGIIPVHDMGQLLDGRHYFTMKEVRGHTLKATIRALHSASSPDHWGEIPGQGSEPGWTFRRLIDVFHKVCLAVAYVHARGVIHRDLKPSNVMIGAFGEVLVMDWGLARMLKPGPSAPDSHAPALREAEEVDPGTLPSSQSIGELEPVVTDRSRLTAYATQLGQVTGTVAYMSPEQARGELDALGPTSDVYSLGAMLYELLSGRPPYLGESPLDVIQQVLAGKPLSVCRMVGDDEAVETRVSMSPLDDFSNHQLSALSNQNSRIPEDLRALCEKAMSRRREDRFPTAAGLAHEVGRWLDGAQRRERAETVLASVQKLPEEVSSQRHEASALRAKATAYLAEIKGYEEAERKRPGWRMQDEAYALECSADLKELEYIQGLRGALAHDPELPEAYAGLAAFYHRQHLEAEAKGDARAATQSELLLRALDRRGEYAAYLRGYGAVTLVTDPEDAVVSLYNFERSDRRLIPMWNRQFGRVSPIEMPLLPGSYLLKLTAVGRSEVSYPVAIARGEHWTGIRPGEQSPFPIRLPGRLELEPDDCYIPAGWFWSGGDLEAYNSHPGRRVWLDPIIMKRFPVTNWEYLEFLNQLLAQGGEALALQWAPQARGARFGEQGAMVYGRDEHGHFILGQDVDGDEWLPNHPVTMVSWPCAVAYADWMASQSGQPWRLPGDFEWEKGARGVDGRWYPWGHQTDPSWACMMDSHRGKSQPSVVEDYPLDMSVYGLRGMGGNVRQWCLEPFTREGTSSGAEGLVTTSLETAADAHALRLDRGGSWDGGPRNQRCAYRSRVIPEMRVGSLGIRLARSFA